MVFAGFAIFQINRRNVAFLIVQFGPDDGLAGRKGFGHVKDALVSGTAELQQRVFLVFEIATVDKDVDRCSSSSLSGVSPGRMSSSHV